VKQNTTYVTREEKKLKRKRRNLGINVEEDLRKEDHIIDFCQENLKIL